MATLQALRASSRCLLAHSMPMKYIVAALVWCTPCHALFMHYLRQYGGCCTPLFLYAMKTDKSYPSSRSTASAWQVCRAAVVLRVLVLVHVQLLVIGLLYMPLWRGVESWLYAGLVLGCSVPATLLWLVGLCTAQLWLVRSGERTQWLTAVLWGGACALLGGVLLASVQGYGDVPWIGIGALGLVLAAQCASWLLWRARLQAPGDVAAQLAELQARIRPHFLFNALNSAIALVQVDPPRAEAVLEDLSELFRHMLRDVRHHSTLGEELELAQRYLQIEQVRFGDRMRLHWQLEPAANLAVMPPLVLQPLLENAIRHGVEPSPQGADISIRTALRGNMVLLQVTNTCPGGSGQAGNGIALHNVRRRLQLLHDVELDFSARMRHQHFVVRIQMPLHAQPPSVLTAH